MDDTEARARNAQQLLENPLLQAVLDEVQQAGIKAWIGTAPNTEGREAREFAWMLVKAVERIRTVLQGAADDGTIAAARAVRPLSKP